MTIAAYMIKMSLYRVCFWRMIEKVESEFRTFLEKQTIQNIINTRQKSYNEKKRCKIDEAKCTGCGLCIPNCNEGALQIIDDKARLISDVLAMDEVACPGLLSEDAITLKSAKQNPTMK